MKGAQELLDRPGETGQETSLGMTTGLSPKSERDPDGVMYGCESTEREASKERAARQSVNHLAKRCGGACGRLLLGLT